MLVKHINNHHYSSVVHTVNAVIWLLVCPFVCVCVQSLVTRPLA